MAKRQQGSSETERTVHFFRAHIGNAADGSPIPFPAAAVATRIDELEWSTGERYLRLDDDVFTACWVDGHGESARIRVANVRRGGLPQVDNLGTLSSLQIPTGAGLAESMHVQFFPNNVVGAMFNFFAPRLPRFGYYLLHHAHDVCGTVRFEPLLRHDVLDRLNALNRITLFRLKIRRGYEDEVAAANESLGAAFRSAFEVGDGQQAEIAIQTSRARDSSLGSVLKRTALRLARRHDLYANASRFVIKGSAPEQRRSTQIDVLSDELLITKTVRLDDNRTRAVNKESAYRAIQAAHEELEPLLRLAPSVSIEAEQDGA